MAGANGEMEHLLRKLTPQVLGAVLRRFHDFGAAEDAVQAALLEAAKQWPREGVPEHARGWLVQVACRRLVDSVRKEQARRRYEAEAARMMDAASPVMDAPAEIGGDDTLTLLFMCCHEALTTPSAIALTLRAVGGLTTAEVAHAFLVPEVTMAQRISRAKQSIQASGVPFALPDERERERRLGAVLQVLYLVFNEGYTTSGGHVLQKPELATEAIRLTRAVHKLLPEDGEVAGLLALLLLTDARSGARTTQDGELIPLSEQDRRLWDRKQIQEGIALLEVTLPKGLVGKYQLQAAIAAVHDEAERAEDTDWRQIAALYELLRSMSDNPMVELNHAIAVAFVRGPGEGLRLLREVEESGGLRRRHRLHAAKAHLLEMAGECEAAVAQYRLAAEGTASMPERNYLLMRSARVAEGLAGVSAARPADAR